MSRRKEQAMRFGRRRKVALVTVAGLIPIALAQWGLWVLSPTLVPDTVAFLASLSKEQWAESVVPIFVLAGVVILSPLAAMVLVEWLARMMPSSGALLVCLLPAVAVAVQAYTLLSQPQSLKDGQLVPLSQGRVGAYAHGVAFPPALAFRCASYVQGISSCAYANIESTALSGSLAQELVGKTRKGAAEVLSATVFYAVTEMVALASRHCGNDHSSKETVTCILKEAANSSGLPAGLTNLRIVPQAF